MCFLLWNEAHAHWLWSARGSGEQPRDARLPSPASHARSIPRKAEGVRALEVEHRTQEKIESRLHSALNVLGSNHRSLSGEQEFGLLKGCLCIYTTEIWQHLSQESCRSNTVANMNSKCDNSKYRAYSKGWVDALPSWVTAGGCMGLQKSHSGPL